MSIYRTLILYYVNVFPETFSIQLLLYLTGLSVNIMNGFSGNLLLKLIGRPDDHIMMSGLLTLITSMMICHPEVQ